MRPRFVCVCVFQGRLAKYMLPADGTIDEKTEWLENHILQAAAGAFCNTPAKPKKGWISESSWLLIRKVRKSGGAS